jgi:vitamin K-dependent gamma-carboxylase-like protein
MNASLWSLRTTFRAFARGWDEFFHQPCDARICAAVRIAYAALVLTHLAVLYPDLELWFTEQGVLPLEHARKAVNPYAWSLLGFLPGTSAVVHICFWITVAHAVAVLVGFLPRLNALFLFLWIMSFQVRNNLLNDGEDSLMRLLGFFLIWLPSGGCWSVNQLIRWWWTRRRPIERIASASQRCEAPGWGLRLLQIEMAAMFLSTGLIKLSGESWLNGTALYYVSRLDDYFGRAPVPAWLFDSSWIVALMTWGVLAAELAVPLLIWFRETRRPCLIVLLAFHLANELTMNLFLFHWLMLCGWMSFLAPEDFRWLRWRHRGEEVRV